MRRALDAKSIVLASLTGGLLVGLCDGFNAGLVVGVGFVGTLWSALLAGGVDLWLGLGLGLFVVVVAKLARWGRAKSAVTLRRVEISAWLLLGLGAAALTGLAIVATAQRQNRFLVAGVVALDAFLLGILGALLAPALGRVIAPLVLWFTPLVTRLFFRLFRRRHRAAAPADEAPETREAPEEPTIPEGSPLAAWPLALERPATAAGLFLLAPLAALAFSALVFLLLWRTSAPLVGTPRIGRIVLVGLVVLLMPATIALSFGQLRRIPIKLALPLALVVFVPLAVWFAISHWDEHLQFVPWRDLRIIGFVVLAAAVLAPVLYRRGPRRVKRILIFLLAPPAALGIALWAGEAEKARKATATAGGLIGPLLSLVRPALDFDHDGFPGLLGGGDCDDRNPKVNPAIQDWPEDGVDEDCDGADLRASDLRAPPLHPVPDSVPRDLNVVVIVIDSLRADRLSAYGYARPTSPEIDRLALDGAVFDNAWAHAPSTRYSMPALVTGRWPSAIRWDTSISWPGIARGQRTIAEAMRELGYFNGAFYADSYFNRGDARGFERGIDQYDDRLAAKHIRVGGAGDSSGSSAREMADDGIDFIRAYRDQKFFLTLHFFDPHRRYERHVGSPNFGNKPGDLYDGEIWYTDKHVGRVIAALRELGLYDKTAVVITSDHGESFGEHGAAAHGRDLYAPETKVPLIVRVPGLGSRRIGSPVGHVDIAPTLVNLARGQDEPSFLGRSFLDLLAGRRDVVTPPVFQEVSLAPETPTIARTTIERRALVTPTHHLIWRSVPENVVFCHERGAGGAVSRDVWGLPPGEAVCPALKKALDRRLSLLKLSDLPPDFAERLASGVTAPGVAVPPPEVLRPADFGALVHFRGYEVKIPGAPFPAPNPPAAAPPAAGPSDTALVRIARGGEVELTTHFEVKGDLSGWRIFFHIDGPGGTGRNLDHTPVGGSYPVERWRSGQTIRDRFTIPFNASEAPGLHTLSIGFWKPPSSARQRLPVTPAAAQDGENRLRVLTFHVE